MYIGSHLERCVLVQTAALYSPGKYVNWNLIFSDFIDCGPLIRISYREFFKVTCAAVQKLYRSSLVCTSVPILKGVFWSKQQSCTAPGKYVNWNFNFFNRNPMIAIENSSKATVRPYRSCTGQVWYVHWFPS